MDATSAVKHSISNIINNNNRRAGGNGEGDVDVVVVENSAAANNNNNNANNPSAAAVGRNPSILLALDSVHRSLLLKNLQFDQEPSGEDGASDSVVSGGVGYRSETEDPLETRKSSEVAEITTTAAVDCPKQITEQPFSPKNQNDHPDVVDGYGILDHLVKVCRDRNNNESTRVMMMVAKFESGKGGGKGAVDETETSDFDTASVSSSSLGSVRSSSAFSEGSRDAASAAGSCYGSERVEPDVIGTGESHVVTAGSATITINIINKTAEDCDTTRGPLRTGPEMKAVHVQVPEYESEVERRIESTGEEESTECEEEEMQRRQAESQEFLDCKDFLDSSTGGYDDSSEETERNDDDDEEENRQKQSPKVINQELIDDQDEPMINIIQELTRDMQVTSTVVLNKAKIKELRKSRSAEKKEKQKNEKKMLENSHLSRQKIIDDNFCNEILDSTIHFDRLYGINRKNAVETPVEVLSDSALQPSSAGDESFDSSMSFGKLEGKPRYSGRPIGKLMARRLEKLDKQGSSGKSDVNSDSSTSNYANGPKKPPRTFASARSHQSKVGWRLGTTESSTEGSSGKPSCPKLQDLDSDPELMGWKFDKPEKADKREKSHHFGWVVPKERTTGSSIPPHIYNMLNYSEDEDRKQLIKTSNSRAAPQASCCHRIEATELGPKLDIDTVDYAPETPRRKSSSNLDFDQFVANSRIKSTPHKRLQFPEIGRRTELFLDSERGERRQYSGSKERRRRTTGDLLDAESRHFLGDSRRSDHEPDKPEESEEVCRKCSEKSKKKSFRKAAVRRTKSFFEASKKKIHLKSKDKQRVETPQKSQLGSNLNKENSIKKQLHKHLGYTSDHLRGKSCPEESTTVRKNLAQTYSAPARIPADKRPKHPVPTVLNFSGPASQTLGQRDYHRPTEMGTYFQVIPCFQSFIPVMFECCWQLTNFLVSNVIIVVLLLHLYCYRHPHFIH